jgi:DnaJ-domain-containing protein 1
MSDVSDWKDRLSRVIRSNARDVADRYEEFEESGGFQAIGEKVKRGFEEFAGYVQQGYRDAAGRGEDTMRDQKSRFDDPGPQGDPMGRDGTTEPHDDADDRSRRHSSAPPASSEEKSIGDYYANLEVEYGADMQTVKKSYRRLMRRYHPDNFSDDPEMEELATELTQELSEAYQKVREHKGM